MRVQRQIGCTGLEAAEHHAQQRQAALGQQRHRLIDPHTRCPQGMAEAVGAGFQLAVRPALIEACRHHLLRVRVVLRFKQAHITVGQRVVAVGVIARLQQVLALGGVDHRQLRERPVCMLANGQQQAFEIGQQTLGGGVVEEARVVRQVQAERVAGVHHHRHRVVGVGARAVGSGADVLGPRDHGTFHRRVFVDKQAVENRLAFVQRTARLNLQQRQVLVLTQRQVVLEQALQPRLDADVLPGTRQLQAQRNAVDEQAHGVLHLGAIDRATGDGHAKQHLIEATVALQDQRPGRLGQGVDGELETLRQLAQGAALTDLQIGIHIADHREAALTPQGAVKRQRGGLLKARQLPGPGG